MVGASLIIPLAARIAKPSTKVPEPQGDVSSFFEQFEAWFEFDLILVPTVLLDESRRCNCMKCTESRAASIYVWLNVAFASRAETLGRSQLIIWPMCLKMC